MNDADNIPMKIRVIKPMIFGLCRRIKSKFIDPEAVFTKIYRENGWNGAASVSGPGSDPAQTRVILRELPRLFKDMNITSVLDIPCGDFYWMRTMDLSNIKYLGGDIVKDIIQNNSAKYEKENIHFQHLNLIKDDLPIADLVLCRDCLVHFSFDDIFLALKKICRSKAAYLLATTFTDRKSNIDIITGQWRELNLSAPPFNLPAPIRVINEECPQDNGLYADKSLGLWKVEDIADRLGGLRK